MAIDSLVVSVIQAKSFTELVECWQYRVKMSQELCPDVEMGLFEPAVLAAGINQLFKLPH